MHRAKRSLSVGRSTEFLLVWKCILTSGLLLGLWGCAPKDTPDAPDEVGRIVSLAPNLTEILFALGLGDKVVAVTQDSDWPVEAVDKPKVGTFWQPNLEAVIAARPDLVVTLAFPQQKQFAERLKQVGCRCLTVNIDHVEELYAAIEQIGAVTETSDKATALIGTIRGELAAMQAARQATVPKVLWVVQRQPLRVAGTKTFADEIIRLAGGQNSISDTIQVYPPIGMEELIATGADVILEPAMTKVDLVKQQGDAEQYWKQYPALPAVRDGRVYVIDGDLVSRLGPRLAEGVQVVASCLSKKKGKTEP
ncbi:MAG: ABC transporter substrate-binding protein [Sedimentisphaerales bacterium]|nr:ABC transporter substrate-binding protein [Sedimentisphaerales bacterium]